MFAILSILVAVTSANRYNPPREELTVYSGPSTLIQALNYKCENDGSKTCNGMKHMEALFGITSYGERKILNLYDGTPHPGSTGCPPVTYHSDKMTKPFVLLINRGVCKFTEKVRAAQDAGAEAVIIVDNVALMFEPLCVCEDYSMPTGDNDRQCRAKDHSTDCTCANNGVCYPIASTPTCATGFPSYQEICPDSTIVGACWKCGTTTPKYYPSDCNTKDGGTHCISHIYLPFMADDGYGGDITIPSVLISDFNGAMLRTGLKEGAMQMKMEWNLPLLESSNLELWTSCEDNAGADFKLDFKETYLRLQDHLQFTPRYYIFDGHRLKCDSTNKCNSQCISNGLYCGRDPDGKQGHGVEGKDVVMENLRQMCIWNVLESTGKTNQVQTCPGNACESGWINKKTPCTDTNQVLECWNSDMLYQCCGEKVEKNTKELMKWWCYVNDFSDTCFSNDGTAMESSESFAKCANEVMVSHDIDTVAVQECMDESFHDQGTKKETNILLSQEIIDRKQYAILTLPTAIVNGRELRGNTASGESMVANVARAVCQGYKTLPVECDKILNPSGTGQPEDGNLGIINFAATLKYTSPSPPTLTPQVYSLDEALQHRFTAALALKIGANPKSLIFEQAVEATEPNAVIVGVKLSNLKCEADSSKATEDIKDALKKIADCGEDIGDQGGEDQAEKELMAMQTFNVHSGTFILSVAIGQVTEDKTLCESPPSHTDDGTSGNIDPSADQNDPGTKDVVPACCSEDPAGACCGTWRAQYESDEVAAGSYGYGGGSMFLMFFLGMCSVGIVGIAAVFFTKRNQMLSRQNGEELMGFSSSGVGVSEESAADYSAL